MLLPFSPILTPIKLPFCLPSLPSGLLRLHSTFRHDLKIYSSDEGRVQMTAAAFTKALLDLEGNLAPILVSRVSNITIYGRITLESTPFINRSYPGESGVQYYHYNPV